MSRKKIFFIVIACFVLLGTSFGITYAYLIANDSAVNEFTIGDNTVKVVEDKYDPPEKLKPGISFTKNPHVKNMSNLPCFVRMRADFSDSAAKDFCEDLNIDRTNWEYDENDGYYYYKKLLQPGEITTELFTEVVVKTYKEDGTPYTDSDMIDFDILVYAESCQHNDHNGSCADDEYKTIW